MDSRVQDVGQAARDLIEFKQDAGKDPIPKFVDAVRALTHLYGEGKIESMAPVLPLLLSLKGRPYSLKDHEPMEPMFSLRPPHSTVMKCARQVTKSTTIAGKDILLTAIIPYFSTLYVSPLYEQTRRFSSNYVRPFLEDSPVRGIMLKPRVEKSVLQRAVANKSTMHFTFASTDCDRTRGISSDCNTFDEVQDFDPDFIPVINETLSHSEYDLRYYSGTPLTSDNVLDMFWQKSSQAEWATKCTACNYWNLAGLAYDLMNMIQKQGVSCAKCGKEIYPASGLWVHAFPDRRPDFSGYHAPQAIFPLHYAPHPKTGKKHRWRELWIAKTELSRALFLNEKCGESCDERPTLLSANDLRRASVLPWPNVFSTAVKQDRRGYHMVMMGADWGGRGRDEVSYTVFAVLGFMPNGNFDVLYGERLPLDLDPTEEAKRALQIYKSFHCSLFAHDYNGAGAIRQTLMRQAGLSQKRIFPAVYSRVSLKGLVTYNPPMEHSAQWYYTVDKARSLVLLCQMIKQRFVRFPQYESWAVKQSETDNPLGHDLLALVEDRKALEGAGDIYLITKRASASDDFSSAINFASLGYWYSQQRFPDLVNKLGLKLTPAQADAVSPLKTNYDVEG